MSYQWPALKVGGGAGLGLVGNAFLPPSSDLGLVVLGLLLATGGFALAAEGLFEGIETALRRSRSATASEDRHP